VSSARRFTVARRATQLGILLAFFAGAQLGLPLLTGTLSASKLFGVIPLADPFAVLQMLAARHVPHTSLLLGAGLVLALYGALLGRAFCSWICPVNLVSDAAAAMNRRFELGELLRLSRSTRYWMLGLSLLLSAALGVAAFEWVSPIGLAVRGVTYGLLGGARALFGLFLFELVILRRGFCGHLCPLGAFWSLVGAKALLHVAFRPEACTHCMACQAACPERQVLSPLLGKQPARRVDAGTCTRCARCVEVCEPRALTLAFRAPAPTPIEEIHE